MSGETVLVNCVPTAQSVLINSIPIVQIVRESSSVEATLLFNGRTTLMSNAQGPRGIGGAESSVGTPGVVFGNGTDTSSLAMGQVAYVPIPYSGTITGWSMVADASCSCVIDVWRSTGALPTVLDSITGAAEPELISEAVEAGLVSVWDTSITEGDILGFKLVSLSGSPKQIILTLKMTGA